MADTPTSASLAQGALNSVNNLGSSSGTTLTQGAAPPNITTAQTTGSSLDPYYAQLEQETAEAGKNAALGAQFAGPTANQQLAFNNAQALTGSQTYQPFLNQASTNLANAANKSAAGAASGYLSQATGTSPLSVAQPLINQGANANLVGAFNPYASAATQTSGLGAANPYLQAGTQSAADLVGKYMNPYTQDVVNQIGQLGQNNIAMNLAPSTTAGIVGAGQFGSTRGAQALGQTISNAQQGVLGQQAQALQTGYGQALQAAQQQLANQLNAGQIAGTLQQQQNTLLGSLGQTAGTLTGQQASNALTAGQNLGTLQQQQNQNLLTAGQTAGTLTGTDLASQIAQAQAQQNLGTTNQALGYNNLNALSTLGAQQQAINQNQQLFPLQTAQSYANLLGSLTKPTSTTSLTNAPANIYGPSGLATATGALSLGAGALGLYNAATGG
jgi:hypothetical protein